MPPRMKMVKPLGSDRGGVGAATCDGADAATCSRRGVLEVMFRCIEHAPASWWNKGEPEDNGPFYAPVISFRRIESECVFDAEDHHDCDDVCARTPRYVPCRGNAYGDKCALRGPYVRGAGEPAAPYYQDTSGYDPSVDGYPGVPDNEFGFD